MAKIRLGGFGEYVAGTPARRPVPSVSVGAGLEALGAGVQRMAAEKQREEDEGLRSRALVVAAQFENDLGAKATELLDREAKGEVQVSELDALYKEETGILYEGALEQFPENSREQYRQLFDLRSIDAAGKFQLQQRGRIQENKARDFDNVLNANAQIALTDPLRAIDATDQYVDLTAPDVHLSAERAGEVKARFRNRAWENNLRNKLVDSKRISEVKDIRKQLDDEKLFPGMVPETRIQLKAYAESKRNSLEAEYEASNRMARAQAKANLDGMTRDLMSGRDIPAETVIGYETYIKGVPDDVPEKRQAMIAQELHPQVRQMLTMTPAARAKFLNEKETALQALTGTARLDALVRANLLQEAAADIERRNANDPYGQWSAYTGLAVAPLDPDLELVPQLAARAQVAAQAQALTGKNPGLILPAERTVMAKAVKGMTQEQAEGFFAAMRKLPNRAMVEQTFQDMGQAEPSVAYAGAFALIEARDEEGRGVGPMILRGQKVIESKSLKMPSPDAFRKEFDALAGGAFKDAEAAYGANLDSVRNYYAAIAATSDKLPDGKIDNSAFERAFRAVMGNNAPVTIHDVQVFPPYGMHAAVFPGAFSAALKTTLDASGVPYTEDARQALMDGAKPRQAKGMGNFYLEWNGGWLLYPPGHKQAGERVLVHVDPAYKPPEPVAPKGVTRGGAAFQ